MGCCYIFNKSLLIDSDIENASINLDVLRSLIPPFADISSGIWQPIIIKADQTTLNKVDFLTQAGDFFTEYAFDPLSCTDQTGQTYTALLANSSLSCDYCKQVEPYDFFSVWRLEDTEGNKRQKQTNYGIVEATITSDCCSGACDTRMLPDDIIPKIPVLNQNYLKKFYDFKYLKEFPATTNPGLGFDEFIKINNMSSFSESPPLVIDWRIKDTISEVSYDKLKSPYNSYYQHNKSLKKSKIVSQTCGNFILTKANPNYTSLLPAYPLLSGLIGDPDQSRVSTNIEDILPSVSDFTIPYGFDKNTHNNIFIKNKKLGSYWKWNYESGVLCWYRYYNKDKKDDRPIQGVDLYIPPGDVFFATNQGPEPPPISFSVPEGSDPRGGYNMKTKACPSGLKVLEDRAIACVIPSGSSFTYISQNLYAKFLEIYNRITVASITDDKILSQKDKFELASLLCTAPEYDKITVDLMLRNKKYEYDINQYFQIDILNKDMLSGTSYGSAGHLNYIKNKLDLINTIADKYGAYLWCPPNTTSTIKMKDPLTSQCLVDLDFDMVALQSDVKNISTNCTTTVDCISNTENKVFAYEQKFNLGNTSFEFKLDTKTRYNTKCINSETQKIQSSRIAGFYLNNSLLKEIPYNSGCYVFQDNYPRILTPDMPKDTCCNSSGIDCAVCDSDSTYSLAGGGAALCKDFNGYLSWCDKTSANYYNNNDPNGFSDRPIRNILNNTLYFKRSYPIVAFDPHIDMVAFHHQGGVFYSHSLSGNPSGTTVFAKGVSNLFGDDKKGDLSITFDTKDKHIGIKIYALTIEKLRGQESESYSCRAFPIKDKCKCFGLTNIKELPYVCNNNESITFTNNPVLYTPNISTTFSPKIKAYGGYSEEKINEMLGGGEISNKIKILQKEIENLNKTIDFMELAGLSYDKDGNSLESFKTIRSEKRATIDVLKNELAEYRIPGHPDPGAFLPALNKYIDPLLPYGSPKSVSINLNNYVTTKYTIQFPAYSTSHADIWASVSENVNFALQRYTTKVSLNENTIIYDQQKKQISDKSNNISVKLSNPFLEALVGGEYILYPPIGSLCSKGGNFSSSGDEISTVNLTFSRIPRKQILSFFIKSPKAMGILKKGFFHPNSGLIDRKQSDPALTPLYKDTKNNIFLSYDKTLFDPDASFSNSGVIYYSEINDSVKRVIEQIGNFSNHRKPRLYLQLNNLWYEYKSPNLFGFYNKNTLNIGQLYIFEYLDSEKNYSVIGPWLPVSVKEHIDFNFIYNYPNQNINISYQRPIVYKNPKKPQQVNIDGSRAYFYVLEIDSALVSLSDSIENLSEDDMNSITIDNPEVVLSNKNRYRYVAGPKNQRSSYIISDYNYLYHNFSDLHINYNLKNKSDYIYNSKKTCNQKVIVINAENTKQTYEARIIEKRLYAIYTDENGNKLKLNNTTQKKYLQIYTQFTLDTQLKYDKAYIDFSCLFNDISNSEGVDSLILFQNLLDNQALKKENDQFLYNNNIQSKWGDLIHYDSNTTHELTKYFISNRYINNVYPSSLYLNNFYKTIINNGNHDNHQFILKINDENIHFNLSDSIYFNIHQKYNVDYGSYKSQYDFWKQNNYLPYIDINILPTGNDINSSRSVIKQYLQNNAFLSGIINISGIYKLIDSTHDWGDYLKPSEGKYFWLNLDTNSTMLSALTPKAGFFSDSLRVDNSPFQLNRIQYSTKINASLSTQCRNIYNPIISNNITFNSNTFDFSHFNTATTGSVFDISLIYCDKDRVAGCANADCNIATVGTGTYSGEYNFYTHRSINVPIKTNNIPYIISYDAGLYNTLGNKSISYITRHELDANNVLFPLSLCDGSVSPRPANHNISILNEEYQSILANSIVDNHSNIVKNTDSMANEMLFRLMYGEQQKINHERIDESNERVKLEDLFRYSYPKTKPEDLYKNIQYDMDITSDCSTRKINGSISINGTLKIGQTTNISINNKNISLNIDNNTTNGTVDIVATCDGKTVKSMIYRTKNISQQTIIATSDLTESGANDNEKYTLLGTCKERKQIDIYLANKITRAEINTRGCSLDDSGNFITVRAIFPYWKNDSYINPGVIDYPDGKPCTSNSANQGCSTGDLDIYFVNEGACGEKTESTKVCTNRRVGPISVPKECVEITRVEASDMRITEYNRSVMSSASCHIGGGVTNPQYDIAVSNIGPIESFIGTRMLDDPVGISLNPKYQTASCGTCFTLDFEDWSFNKIYNKFGREFPVLSVSTNDACECADYTYGYCRNSEDAASCACASLDYNNYTAFDYTFEYCKHSITLKGHKRRLEGKLKNPEIISDPAPTITLNSLTPPTVGLCDGVVKAGKSEGYKYPNNQDPNLVVTEQCVWYHCDRTNPQRYYIHNKTTTTNIGTYTPTCSQLLCNILYDNNTININLGGSSNTSLCIPIEIRNDCPSITVTVPDDSYSVLDSIESECSDSSVDANRAIAIDQHPAWDIVTETRTCVLGYVLQGNPNENGPVYNMGGSQTIPCNICVACPSINSASICKGWTSSHAGYGLCGKNAPDSYPWHVCISKLNQGYVCVGGNHHDRWGDTTQGYVGYPIVMGCDIPVNYPIETSNERANEYYLREWESNMRQIYENIASCNVTNTSAVLTSTINSNRIYDVADIVEGVVPNSCSEVLFTTLTYPGIRFKTGLNNPIVQNHTIQVKVAYYTYSYRRPKNIQDILKGEEISKQCNELATKCDNNTLRVSSNYWTKDCDNSPSCYDTNMQKCTDNDNCCKNGRTRYE